MLTPRFAGSIQIVHLKRFLCRDQWAVTFSTHEARFVRNGKAEVQVWLNEKSAATINQLKELGFEVVLDPKSAKMVIGRVPLERLEALARLKFVRYVSPQVAAN